MFEEQLTFLDIGIAVIEDLREEGIQALEGAHVALEQHQRIHFILGRFYRLAIAVRLGRPQLILRDAVTHQQAVGHGLQSRTQLTLTCRWIE
ncbi:hypothetical protein FQZ97_691220 [compost metagenome]